MYLYLWHHLSGGCGLFPWCRRTLAYNQTQLSSSEWFSSAAAQGRPEQTKRWQRYHWHQQGIIPFCFIRRESKNMPLKYHLPDKRHSFSVQLLNVSFILTRHNVQDTTALILHCWYQSLCRSVLSFCPLSQTAITCLLSILARRTNQNEFLVWAIQTMRGGVDICYTAASHQLSVQIRWLPIIMYSRDGCIDTAGSILHYHTYGVDPVLLEVLISS